MSSFDASHSMGVVVGGFVGVVVGVDVGLVVAALYAVVTGMDNMGLVAMVMDDDLSQNMEMFAGEMKSSLLPPIKTAFWE